MTFGNYTLTEALDGLMAYDQGCRSSGIHDEKLRQQVKEYLNGLDDTEFRLTVSKFARSYLTDEMLDRGYGLEDVVSLNSWLEEFLIR